MDHIHRSTLGFLICVTAGLLWLGMLQGQGCTVSPPAIDSDDSSAEEDTGDDDITVTTDGDDMAALTDAVGDLGLIWVSSFTEEGRVVTSPSAAFQETAVPWYFAGPPSDRVWALAASDDEEDDDGQDDEGDEGEQGNEDGEGEQEVFLDAGTPLLVTGSPDGDIQLDRQADNSYTCDLLSGITKTFSPGDTAEWVVPGGDDVSGFTQEMPVPEPLIMTNPAAGVTTIDRSVDLVVTWQAPQIRQDAHILVLITSSSDDCSGIVQGDFIDDGSATIGVEYLSQLPSDEVTITAFRGYFASQALTTPAGKKVYFSSQVTAEMTASD